jgi:hypothetical protein
VLATVTALPEREDVDEVVVVVGGEDARDHRDCQDQPRASRAERAAS